MKILFPFLISSLFSQLFLLYLRSKHTVFDDDGINFIEIKSNETTEDYTLTLPREEEVEEETTELYLTLPREEIESNNSCTSISKYLYIQLFLEDDLNIKEIEVKNFNILNLIFLHLNF